MVEVDSAPLPLTTPLARQARQPAGGISTICLGGNLTLEESEQLQTRRPTSDSKKRELTGSRIFYQESISEPVADLVTKSNSPAGLVTPVQSGSRSRVMTDNFALSPKRSASLSEMAKQRELSGTLFVAGSDKEAIQRRASSAKCKELEGSNIFGKCCRNQSNKINANGLANDLKNCQENNAPPRTSVKVSHPAGGQSQIIFGSDEGDKLEIAYKKGGHNQKSAELSGPDVSKGMATTVTNNNSSSQSEQTVGNAKRQEMLGTDIISNSNLINDGQSRRARQPPGGKSNLKLY